MLELLALCRVASAFSHTYTNLFEVSLFNKMNACNLIVNIAPPVVTTDVDGELTMATLDTMATNETPTEPLTIQCHDNVVLVTVMSPMCTPSNRLCETTATYWHLTLTSYGELEGITFLLVIVYRERADLPDRTRACESQAGRCYSSERRLMALLPLTS